MYTNIEGTRRHKNVPTILTETVAIAFFCVLIYWKCPAKNSANGISESLNLTIFRGVCPQTPYNGPPSSLQLFSPRAYTFRLSTPVRNACIRILGWWCVTCGTPELGWRTGAAKTTTERKLPVPRANAFSLRLSQDRMSYYHSLWSWLSWCFLLLVLLANCGIGHILKERRKRHQQSTKLKVHYKIYCNENP